MQLLILWCTEIKRYNVETNSNTVQGIWKDMIDDPVALVAIIPDLGFQITWNEFDLFQLVKVILKLPAVRRVPTNYHKFIAQLN